ncbi:MAG: glycosyltransferase family 2 protein [Candidatus Cryptobacteroides sp.]
MKHRIAALLTVFNRKAKTLACLGDLYAVMRPAASEMDIFLVDGGSSDGTPEAVREAFPEVRVEVCEGLYWAGGMRRAWNMSLESGLAYSHFLLVNDDTRIFPQALSVLAKAEDACPGGIYLGATADPRTGKCSYGGRALLRPGHEKSRMLIPDGTLQKAELGNANIMLVSREAFERLGILCPDYTHGIADYDYTLSAVAAGIPVLLAADYCGECSDDHGRPWKSQNTTLRKRIDYLYSPKGLAYKEYMHYVEKFFPKDAFGLRIKLWMKTLFPFLWEMRVKRDNPIKVIRP